MAPGELWQSAARLLKAESLDHFQPATTVVWIVRLPEKGPAVSSVASAGDREFSDQFAIL